MTWCWLRHRWTVWMLFGTDGLEVRSCLTCRTVQWRGGPVPMAVIRLARERLG